MACVVYSYKSSLSLEVAVVIGISTIALVQSQLCWFNMLALSKTYHSI